MNDLGYPVPCDLIAKSSPLDMEPHVLLLSNEGPELEEDHEHGI